MNANNLPPASGEIHNDTPPHALDRGARVSTPEFTATLVGRSRTGRDVWYYDDSDYTYTEACVWLDSTYK